MSTVENMQKKEKKEKKGSHSVDLFDAQACARSCNKCFLAEGSKSDRVKYHENHLHIMKGHPPHHNVHPKHDDCLAVITFCLAACISVSVFFPHCECSTDSVRHSCCSFLQGFSPVVGSLK